MPGVYCPRCKTNVTLEQDGESCSNCGRKLVIADPTPDSRRRKPHRTLKQRQPDPPKAAA